MYNIENEVETEALVSFGAGSGSRAANRNAAGRQGGRRANRGAVTGLRNRIARAQAPGVIRGRGSRARRAALADLATRAQGNTRGNLTRRQARALSTEIRALMRELGI